MRNHSFLAAALVGAALSTTAQAAAPSYLGPWRIDSAVMAPWAYAGRSDAAEKARLLGKTVTLLPRAIAGPEPFACKGPHYKLVDYGPDMLFQGALEEQHDANPKVTAAALAASLGFVGASWKTLDTGCELDWHFVGPSTVKIGLNNYVYTLTKR